MDLVMENNENRNWKVSTTQKCWQKRLQPLDVEGHEEVDSNRKESLLWAEKKYPPTTKHPEM